MCPLYWKSCTSDTSAPYFSRIQSTTNCKLSALLEPSRLQDVYRIQDFKLREARNLKNKKRDRPRLQAAGPIHVASQALHRAHSKTHRRNTFSDRTSWESGPNDSLVSTLKRWLTPWMHVWLCCHQVPWTFGRSNFCARLGILPSSAFVTGSERGMLGSAP